MRRLSSTAYLFAVQANDSRGYIPNQNAGELSEEPLFFEGAGCIGPAFLSVSFEGHTYADGLPTHQGVVFRLNPGISAPAPHFYAPVGSSASPRNFLSRLNDSGGSCDSINSQDTVSVSVLPNDPSVTGVPNEPFTPPITLRP